MSGDQYKDFLEREVKRIRVEELEKTLVGVCASLAAAISLLERTPKAKKAAPSDKMFDQMLDDYRKSLEEARALLRLENE